MEKYWAFIRHSLAGIQTKIPEPSRRVVFSYALNTLLMWKCGYNQTLLRMKLEPKSAVFLHFHSNSHDTQSGVIRGKAGGTSGSQQKGVWAAVAVNIGAPRRSLWPPRAKGEVSEKQSPAWWLWGNIIFRGHIYVSKLLSSLISLEFNHSCGQGKGLESVPNLSSTKFSVLVLAHRVGESMYLSSLKQVALPAFQFPIPPGNVVIQWIF